MIKKSTANRPLLSPSRLLQRARVVTSHAPIWLGVVLFLAPPSGYSEAPQACGTPPALTFPPLEGFERIAVTQPGVVCAFRHKIEGFPTITVTQEPPGAVRTDQQKAREVESSYRSVGFTDARVIEESSREIAGISALQIRLHYTSTREAMESLVVLLELPDRTYTVTGLYRAGGTDSLKEALFRALEGVAVEGIAGTASPPRARSRSWFIILGLLAVFVCGLMIVKRVRTAQRAPNLNPPPQNR